MATAIAAFASDIRFLNFPTIDPVIGIASPRLASMLLPQKFPNCLEISVRLGAGMSRDVKRCVVPM